MKDTNRIVINKASDIVKRWEQYFEHVVNEENERLMHDSVDPN